MRAYGAQELTNKMASVHPGMKSVTGHKSADSERKISASII